LAGLEVSSYPVPLSYSKFDLAVFMAEDQQGFVGYWVYATDVFERETVLRIGRQFERLVESAVCNPDMALALFDLLSEEEKRERQAASLKRKREQAKQLMFAKAEAVEIASE
jgi:non-ribosomal peptide synthetase component F